MSEGREAPLLPTLLPIRRSPVHLARAVGCLDQHLILDVARLREERTLSPGSAVGYRLRCARSTARRPRHLATRGQQVSRHHPRELIPARPRSRNESALFVRVVAVQDRLECDAGFLLRLRAGATTITSASAARTRPYARSVTLCLFERLTSSCYWRR
jgi:hypothetical protein